MWNRITKKFVEPTTNNGDELVMVTLDVMNQEQEIVYRVAVHNTNSRISEYLTKTSDDVREVYKALDCAPAHRTLIEVWGFTE